MTTTSHITIKIDADTQDLLTKAAALTGMSSINSFVLSAAIEKAKQIIEKNKRLNSVKRTRYFSWMHLMLPRQSSKN